MRKVFYFLMFGIVAILASCENENQQLLTEEEQATKARWEKTVAHIKGPAKLGFAKRVDTLRGKRDYTVRVFEFPLSESVRANQEIDAMIEARVGGGDVYEFTYRDNCPNCHYCDGYSGPYSQWFPNAPDQNKWVLYYILDISQCGNWHVPCPLEGYGDWSEYYFKEHFSDPTPPNITGPGAGITCY